MFRHQTTVLLNHTDCYGIIFFANQPIFCHAAFQAWLLKVGRSQRRKRPDGHRAL